jgi:hypothetical protein
MRSKSVQQSRPGAGPNNNKNNNNNNNKLNEKLDRLNNDKRSVSNVKNRPASMYEGSKPQANNAKGGGGKPTGGGAGAGMNIDQKKAMKSAFGHAVMNEKLPPNKGLGGGAGPAANKNPPPQNNKFGNQNNNNNFKNDLMPPKKMKDDFAINGFAKLQQKVQGQPLVVSYEEDENPMAGNKNRRGGGGGGGRGEMEESLELRGQSHYIPVTDDDNSYNFPPQRKKNDKQVSDVLMNARKGKFA